MAKIKAGKVISVFVESTKEVIDAIVIAVNPAGNPPEKKNVYVKPHKRRTADGKPYEVRATVRKK